MTRRRQLRREEARRERGGVSLRIREEKGKRRGQESIGTTTTGYVNIQRKEEGASRDLIDRGGVELTNERTDGRTVGRLTAKTTRARNKKENGRQRRRQPKTKTNRLDLNSD